MPIDLDGLAVLRAVAAKPTLFPGGMQSINELAHKLVAERLTKSNNLESVREIYRSLNTGDFALVVDELSDPTKKKIAKRLDPHHPDIRSGDPAWCQRQIVRLAAGNLEPAQKPPKAAKAPKRPALPKKPRAKRTLSSRAMTAVWDGKNHDND